MAALIRPFSIFRAIYGAKPNYEDYPLYLVDDVYGIPGAFELLLAAWDELDPIQDLLTVLREGSQVVADKGYVSQKDELLVYVSGGARLIPKCRCNKRGNS